MHIDQLQFYLQNAIPMVYDDSLSFLEFNGKVLAKLNEMIAATNAYFNTDLTTYVGTKLAEWRDDGTLDDIIESALGAGLTAHLADNPLTPKRYAAVGDGVTDDTTAVQAALTAVAVGGIVDLGGHSFAVSGVTIAKKLKLMNGKLILLNTATASVITINSGVTGAILEGLEISINTALSQGVDLSGIFVNGSTDTIIRDCQVTGSKNTNYADPYMHSCIYALGCHTINIVNCVVKGAEKEGIMTDDCDDVFISGCRAEDCGLSGLGTSYGLRAVIDNCVSYRSGASGISMNTPDGIVSNCLVSDNATNNGITMGHIIEDAYADNCQVFGNRIINSKGHGIAVSYSKNCLVENNNITLCDGSGIVVIPNPGVVAKTIIKGNIVDACGVYGISQTINANGAVGFCLVDGNIVTNTDDIGIKLNNAGDNLIVNNIIKSALKGMVISGPYIVNSRVDTMLSCEVRNNQIHATQKDGICLLNIGRMIIQGNSFFNINMSNNASGHVINGIAAVPGGTAALPLPGPMIITDNAVNTISAQSVFVYLPDSAFDATVRKLIFLNNEISELDPGMYLSFQVTEYVLTAYYDPMA